jgi:hypothetical protein
MKNLGLVLLLLLAVGGVSAIAVGLSSYSVPLYVTVGGGIAVIAGTLGLMRSMSSQSTAQEVDDLSRR